MGMHVVSGIDACSLYWMPYWFEIN